MPPAATQPVYVLFGDDAFLRDAARKEIVASLIGDADPQVCVASLEATAELADVFDELRTLPLLAPHRAVIVRDADAFVAAYRGQLEEYLVSPSDTASLILIVSSWPKNTRLYKIVNQCGKAIDCGVPERGDLGAFLRNVAEKRGKKIAPAAVDLLQQWIGADLAGLNGEIEKLTIYVGDRETISPEDVSAIVSATAGPAAFALTNALTAGDGKRALESLDGMLTTRGEEFKVLGMIGWHLRKAMRTQQLIAQGSSPDAALRTCRVFYGKREFLSMLQRRPAAVLQNDFRRMIRADLGMKTGANPAAALQQLVMALCN